MPDYVGLNQKEVLPSVLVSLRQQLLEELAKTAAMDGEQAYHVLQFLSRSQAALQDHWYIPRESEQTLAAQYNGGPLFPVASSVPEYQYIPEQEVIVFREISQEGEPTRVFTMAVGDWFVVDPQGKTSVLSSEEFHAKYVPVPDLEPPTLVKGVPADPENVTAVPETISPGHELYELAQHLRKGKPAIERLGDRMKNGES